MRYVRGRRLTEAAKVLSDGAPDILTVALDAGYGSHEAFTRAFRDQFGVKVAGDGYARRLPAIL
jgi:AraC family transcriptional regulator